MSTNSLDQLDIAYYEHVVVPALQEKWPMHMWRYEHPDIIWMNNTTIRLGGLTNDYLEAFHNTMRLTPPK